MPILVTNNLKKDSIQNQTQMISLFMIKIPSSGGSKSNTFFEKVNYEDFATKILYDFADEV